MNWYEMYDTEIRMSCQLKQYRRTHWRTTFQNEMCVTAFIELGDFTRHLLTLAVERPCKCEAFSRTCDRKKHMHTYTGQAAL